MVFLYKRLCALCMNIPPGDHESAYPDIRNNPPLFDICRSFKVQAKRKCPVCPDCVVQLESIVEFSNKCNRTQNFINACFQRKLHRDQEVHQYREEVLLSHSRLDATRPKETATDNWMTVAQSEDEDPSHFVEVVTEKDIVLEVKGPLPEQLDIPGDFEDEIIEDDPDFIQEEDDDDEDEEDQETDSEEDGSQSPKPIFKMPRKRVRPGIPRTPSISRSFKYNFKCSQCDLILHSQHHLELHERKHAPKAPPKPAHVCEVCGKAFTAPSSLRAHSVIHSEERPFPCDKCELTFKNAYGLKCHQETHADTKYVCPTCGVVLSTNHTYHAHLKIHSDRRAYKCPVCPKAFKRHTPLKEHLFGHTDLRPYSCPFCEKTFVNGSSCRLHKVRLHPKELAELEASGRNEEVLEKHRNLPSLEEIKAIICAKFGIPNSAEQQLSS